MFRRECQNNNQVAGVTNEKEIDLRSNFEDAWSRSSMQERNE